MAHKLCQLSAAESDKCKRKEVDHTGTLSQRQVHNLIHQQQTPYVKRRYILPSNHEGGAASVVLLLGQELDHVTVLHLEIAETKIIAISTRSSRCGELLCFRAAPLSRRPSDLEVLTVHPRTVFKEQVNRMTVISWLLCLFISPF